MASHSANQFELRCKPRELLRPARPVTYLLPPAPTSTFNIYHFSPWCPSWRAASRTQRSLRLAATADTPTAHAPAARASAEAVGIVIVDHGSRKDTSNAMLFEFVDLYK